MPSAQLGTDRAVPPGAGSKFVVAGAGRIGRAVAAELLSQCPGAEVVVISRRARQPVPGAKHSAVDLSQPEALASICSGAAGLVNALNPPNYHRWPVEWPPLMNTLINASRASGAVLATISNLYMYGPLDEPITAATPETPSGPKGKVKAEMWQQVSSLHQDGELRGLEVRGSDFMDAGANTIIGLALAGLSKGRAGWYPGDPTKIHSWTYPADVAATLVAALLRPEAHGRVWLVPNAPAISAQQVVADVAAAGGWPAGRVRGLPGSIVSLAGLFSKLARESKETAWTRQRNYVADAAQTTKELGVTFTPWPVQAKAIAAQLAI